MQLIFMLLFPFFKTGVLFIFTSTFYTQYFLFLHVFLSKLQKTDRTTAKFAKRDSLTKISWSLTSDGIITTWASTRWTPYSTLCWKHRWVVHLSTKYYSFSSYRFHGCLLKNHSPQTSSSLDFSFLPFHILMQSFLKVLLEGIQMMVSSLYS